MEGEKKRTSWNLFLLLSLLPLLAYILVEELWGETPAVIMALVTGGGEFLWTWIKQRKTDLWILADTLLVMLLGLLSLFLRDSRFFLVKPALFGFIMSGLLFLEAYTPWPLLSGSMKRYAPWLPEGSLKRLSRPLFFLFFLHSLLTLYAALFLSRRVWAFVSTTLLPLLLLGATLATLLGRRIIAARRWRLLEREEQLPIVNDEGRLLGKAPRSLCHGDPSLLHPVVRLHLFSRDGDLYLQKRSPNKETAPGLWETSVSGHILFGEKPEEALKRECLEELGWEPSSFAPFALNIRREERESEWVISYAALYDGLPLKTDPQEITEGRFWSYREIKEGMDRGVFTPQFLIDFPLLEREKLFRKRPPLPEGKEQP